MCEGNGGTREKDLLFSLFKERDYEGILSLGLVNLCLECRDGVSFFDIAADILKNCDRSIKKRLPVAYMRLAYPLFASGQFDGYTKLLAEAGEIAGESDDENLMGEWHMISAYEVFPDIPAMTERYRRAAEYLSGPCRVVSPCEPFMFGCPSMWYLFHTRMGGADTVADELDAMLSVYTPLTGGHGAGAGALYRSEIACMRGQFEHALRLAGQARELAQASSQATVLFGVALVLGRIAVTRSDEEALNSVINYMDEITGTYEYMRGSAMNECVAGAVRSLLLSMLGRPESLSWRGNASALTDRTLVPTMLLAMHAPMSGMIFRSEYQRAINVLEPVLLLDSRMCSLAARHYVHIALGLCNMGLGNMERAVLHIERALEISGPDRIFTTFIRFKKELMPIFNLPYIREKHAESIARINVLEAGFAAKGMFNHTRLRGAMPDTLTKREVEIARLAASGLRNGEIAGQLYISEATVKGYMKTIFQKLDIDRRSKLAELIH